MTDPLSNERHPKALWLCHRAGRVYGRCSTRRMSLPSWVTTARVNRPSSRRCQGCTSQHPAEILFEGKPMHFADPRDAIAAGIATVYQDLAMIPLMSVSRNFFMGNEPVKKGAACLSSIRHANEIDHAEMRKMGINLRGPDQAVGTLSGGERQTVAIARRGSLRCESPDPWMSPHPLWACAKRPTFSARFTRCASRGSASFSSPTTCATLWLWAIALPCSTAVKRSARPTAARSNTTSCTI